MWFYSSDLSFRPVNSHSFQRYQALSHTELNFQLFTCNSLQNNVAPFPIHLHTWFRIGLCFIFMLLLNLGGDEAQIQTDLLTFTSEATGVYLHSVFTCVDLEAQRSGGDEKVGSPLFFQFELCCSELINLFRGDQEAAAQLNRLVFSGLGFSVAWKPEQNLPLYVYHKAELEFATKTNKLLHRNLILFHFVCCREWVWSSRVAGFPQSREQPKLPLCTAPVWPVGHGLPPLQTAVRLRPRYEPNRGQVRLAGGLTRKYTSQLLSSRDFCSVTTLKQNSTWRQKIISTSQLNSRKWFRSFWVHIYIYFFFF